MPHERKTKLDLLIEKHLDLAGEARENNDRPTELHFLESATQAAVKLNNYGRHLRKE